MPKDSNRPLRVAELVKRELAPLIRNLDDPRVHAATITHVDVAPDLKSARVYFTLLAGATGAEPVLRAFRRAAPHLRRGLAGRLALRVVPELRFEFDESVERGDRITRLIEQAVRADRASKNGE